MKKPKIAIVRGKFLNKCEMQTYEHLANNYDITAFGSLTSFHANFKFPVQRLPSPIDVPDFPYKMPVLNRLFIDAHYLLGLQEKLRGYDIAHSAETYYRYTQQCLKAKKKGWVKRVVVSVYENIPSANEGIWGRKNFKGVAYRDVDLFLAVTQSAKDALTQEGVDGKKVKVIGAGVDIERFSPKKKNKSKDQIEILFVGRLEKYKGIFNVLEAFMKIQKKHKNTYLKIVGSGSEGGNLKKIIKEKKLESKITFKEISYDKIHKEYQQSDIFVAPSIDTNTWKEQFGYVLVEAMACGLPIITSNAGSIPEVVKNAAVIIPQDDTKRLYQELNTLIESKSKREELCKKARSRVIKCYDSRKIARNIRKIYQELI